MAEYKCQKEVRERAEQYTKALIQAGFNARLLEHTFRDYTVKIAVERSGQSLGNVNIYFSSKLNKYTLKTHELKKHDFDPDLERVWSTGESATTPVERGLRAYVDGSFLNGRIGYGAVVLSDGQVIKEISGSIKDASDQSMSMHQVGGEIQAVYEALEWAVKEGISAIEIFYDYKGLEAWSNGGYEAKNLATQRYRDYIRNCPVKITWRKVESHSGDRWNDRADELAKKGAQGDKTTEPTDLIQELEKTTREFVAFLAAKDIGAYFDGIYNGQHSRIKFSGTAGTNILDIYNTKKVHLEPKWHGFTDKVLAEKVRDHWNLFAEGARTEQARDPIDESVQIIGSYLEILRPYRNLRFDFIELARMVEGVAGKSGFAVSVEKMRYDFDLMEKNYAELIGDHHG